MKRCIGSAKPHTIVFRFFARYYDAEEVIHKRISWNWENISKSGPKVRPIIMKNWIFDEKVHRIRKTSYNRFSLFRKILRCWRSDWSAHFLILRKYLKTWAQIRPIIMGPKFRPIMLNEKLNIWWKGEYSMKRCIGSAKPHTIVFRFFARYYDAEEVIHKRISWNWENISKSGPKVRPIIMKNWNLMKRCI